MAKASKRLPSSVSVSKSALDSATLTLQDLPEKPKENWSLREAVSVLQESISAALSKGYSYEEVAKMLTTKGVDISASSLKSYLSAAKRQQGIASVARGKRGGRRKSTEAGTASVDSDPDILTYLDPSPSTIIADADPPAPTKTRRKSAAVESTPAPRQTAAKTKTTAKTSSSAVAKSKDTSRGGRGRKKD